MFQTGQLQSRILYMTFHTLTSDEDNNMYIRFNIMSPSIFRAHTRMKKYLQMAWELLRTYNYWKILLSLIKHYTIMTFARASGISLWFHVKIKWRWVVSSTCLNLLRIIARVYWIEDWVDSGAVWTYSETENYLSLLWIKAQLSRPQESDMLFALWDQFSFWNLTICWLYLSPRWCGVCHLEHVYVTWLWQLKRVQ